MNSVHLHIMMWMIAKSWPKPCDYHCLDTLCGFDYVHQSLPNSEETKDTVHYRLGNQPS